jgi:ATP-dependent metalloprotease
LAAKDLSSNAVVLKVAKRLRQEVQKVSNKEEIQKQLGSNIPILAKRDNLPLYTRLVRLQMAYYHTTTALEKDAEKGTSSAAGKSMNEEFHFVPPTATSGGHHQGDIGSQSGGDGSKTARGSPFGHGKETVAGASSSTSSAGSAWNYNQFASSGGESAKGEAGGAGGAASGPTKANPLPIYIVPNKYNWMNWALTAILIGVMIYFWSNSSGSGGGPLSALLGNRFEIAEPGELTFDDVKGNAEAKEELFDVVEYLKDPEQFAKMGIKIPKGILLTGPPGTGKTMLARVVASESGVPFISTSGAEFEEMLVGVGARRVRQLFELAKKNAPCIVFIDEIDAVGTRRDDMNNHHRMSINQLLVEMDGFAPNEGIVVIGATNLSEVLDPALIRPGRFDRKVSMELPDPKARKEILDHYLRGKKLDDDVATTVLARASAGFSGADLETMVNWAAIISSKKKTPVISMKMLEEALFNVAMGRERRSLVLNDFTRKLCAYHEGGHALVSLHTPGSMDIRRATLVPRGDALGMVNYLAKEDSPLTTQMELLARMDTAMGGRAAEELIYGPGQITQGAGSDFEQATNIARTMVMQLGMSPRLGPVHLSTDRNARISSGTLSLVEEETHRLLRESYDRAFGVLKSHEKELHLLAAALLKYESLTVEEIKRVIAGDSLPEKALELEKSKDLDKQLEEEASLLRQKRKEAAAERRRKAAASSAPNDSKSPSEEPKVKVNLVSSKDE